MSKRAFDKSKEVQQRVAQEKKRANKGNKVVVLVSVILLVVLVGAGVLYNTLSSGRPGGLAVASSHPVSTAGAAGSQDPNAGLNKAVDFTVYDVEGNAVKLSDFYGKPIVLNFWASWCPPCKGEMPEFERVYKELGEDVVFLMLDVVDGSRETAEIGAAYIKEMGYTFPVYYDNDQDAAALYGITGIPMTVFINADGYVVTSVRKAIDETALRQGISLAMGQ